MTIPRAGMGGVISGWAVAVAVAVVLSSSTAAVAEPIYFLRTADVSAPMAHPGEQQKLHRTSGVAFNQYGDLEVRCSDVTMTMAYNPPSGEIQSSQERIRLAWRQDIPAISGISIRISMDF